MSPNNKELIRMELQIGQLIRIVANLNERIIELEGRQNHENILFVKSISGLRRNTKRTPELR